MSTQTIHLNSVKTGDKKIEKTGVKPAERAN